MRRSGERPVEMVYRVSPPGGAARLGLTPERIAEFTAREELPFERPREKRVQKLNLRPCLASVELDGQEVVIALQPTARGAARPAEIMSLLTGKPLAETRTWPTTKTSMRTAP